jgi:hypothetical protein
MTDESATTAVTAQLRQALVGAWTLVSCVETDVESGEVFLPMGDRPRGFILYTHDGYMSAQLSSPDRRPFADGDMYRGTPDEYAEAGRSYLAYSGPFRVDEVHRTVVHGMSVSAFPNWAGDEQTRIVELEDDVLRLRTAQPAMFAGSLKDAVITWRRAPDRS